MCHLYEQLRHWLRRARVKTNICLPLPSMPPSNLPTHRRHRNLPDFATQMLAGMPKSEPRYILFPLILLEMFLQLNWSPPVIHSIDWTWLGIATPAYIRSHSWQCMSEQTPSHGVKGIICRPQKQDCVKCLLFEGQWKFHNMAGQISERSLCCKWTLQIWGMYTVYTLYMR